MPIRRTSNKSSYDSGFYNPEVYSDVGSRVVTDFDPNAFAYLSAVEAADGQSLEVDVKTAINNFIVGCKADGIWTALKASCILSGARTLSGALVPLVGTAPTNFNFWGDADPHWANVSLLLRMNGANASTTFTDSSSNAFTVSRFGNAQISTAQSKFGGASGLFDGTGDAATVPNSLGFRLNGDFTVELWVYPINLINERYFLSHYDYGSAQRDWRFGVKSTTGHLHFQFVAANGSTENEISAGAALTQGVWQHIAVSKSGSTSRIFINGVQQASTTSLIDLGGSSASLSVGSLLNSGTPAFGVDAYIDDLRITKGVARYTANFTPPTQTFPGATADYDRKTGLVGDGSTKYLDSNRNNNAEPQNSKHLSVFCSSASTASAAGRTYIGISSSVAGSSWLHGAGTSNNLSVRANTSTSLFDLPSSSALTGFIGVARDNSSTSSYRYSGTTSSGSAASVSPGSESIKVFLGISVSSHSNARLAFYSIGESLNLALLDTRVTTLINAIAAAIP